MRHFFLATIAFQLASLVSNAQVPDAFNYQAVARNSAGAIMANQNINVTFRIFPSFSGGLATFEEDHAVTTNQFGLFTAKIGTGTPVTGTLASVNWAGNENWLEVEVNGAVVGTRSQFVAVPYALLARDVENDAVDDADADPTNELQTISKTGSTITLSNGGGSVTDDNTTYSAGSGINITGNTISNTAPDQTVTINSGTGVSVTGTYPNFTVTNTGDTDASNDITNATTAGGDLNGTYPNPTVDGLQGRSVASTAPANGEVLKWNTGNNRWEPATDNTAGGGAVTGSGTATFLPKWTSTSALGNSVVFETAGGFIGIGTTTPGYAFELRAPLTNNAMRITTTGANSNVDLVGDATGTGNFRIRSSGGNNGLVFQTAGNIDRMIVNASGNVGIGTTAPTARLHVVSTAVDADMVVDGAAPMYIGLLEGGALRGYVGSLAGAAGDVDFGTDGANASGALHLTIQEVPKLTVSAIGDVGIGTTTPDTRLQVVNGAGWAADFDGGAASYITISESGSYRGYWGSFSGAAEDVDIGTGSGNTTGSMHLTIQASPALTINPSSNVGIGTTAPAYRLDVSHGGATGIRVKSSASFSVVDIDAFSGDAALRFINNGVNQWNIRNRPADNYLEIFELGGGGSRLVIQDATGNLGVGQTTTPASKLSVLGNASIGTTYSAVAAPPDGAIIEGIVGIGTDAPAYKLDVLHGGSTGVRVKSSSGFSVVDIDAFSGDAALRFMNNGASQWNIRNRPADNYLEIFELGGGGSRLVIQDGTGNLGLGTGNPSNRLDVSGGMVIGAGYAGVVTAPTNGFTVEGQASVGNYSTGSYGNFAVQGAGGVQGNMVINKTDGDGVLIRFRTAGTTQGSIDVAGTTVSYNAFTGSHYAWSDDKFENAALVSYTGYNKRLEDNPGSEVMYGIALTQSANDPKVLGSYLALQAPQSPHTTWNPHLVMAVGNGEMWVVDNGQNLQPGDYLISSSTPGHAMLDNGEFEIAYVVARVAEPVDWTNVQDTVDGRKHAVVSVTFEHLIVNHLAKRLQKEIDGLKTAHEAMRAELEELKAIIVH